MIEKGRVTFASLNVNFMHVYDGKSILSALHGLRYHRLAHDKLARAVQGNMFNVVVNLCFFSSIFCQWAANTFSMGWQKQLWIPPRFAYGFAVLTKAAKFFFKTTDHWYIEFERDYLSNDTALGIVRPIHFTLQLAIKNATGRVFPAAHKFE